MTYRWFGATDTGKTRTENQDSVLPDGPGEGVGGVVAVADGLGGHPGGDIASRNAIEALHDAPQDADGSELVKRSHDRIVARIAEALGERSELIGMATTLTLAVLTTDEPVEVAHVGDSRAYLQRGEILTMITDDHTIGMDRVRDGEVSIEEAQDEPEWHIINNWLGFESYTVATYRVEVTAGDRLLLCTDGLTNMVPHEEIAVIMAVGTVAETASALLDAANDAGGADNISVVVVDVLEA